MTFGRLTNTHMTPTTGFRLAKFGRSKQKPTIVPWSLWLLATERADFRAKSVLPGNVSEPGTLLDALDSLVTEDEGEQAHGHHGRRHSPRTISPRCASGTFTGLLSSGASQAGSGRSYEDTDPDATFETKSGHEAGLANCPVTMAPWSQARQDDA